MPSNYNLFLTNQAKKELSKIKKGNPLVARKIAETINRLADDPNLGDFLHGDLKGRRKIRVGDYRIIYSAARQNLLIYIFRIAHRKEVYK